jgi:lipoprotein NlpI
MALGRLEEAAAEFQEAARIKPDYVEAHNNLGSVLHRLDRLDEASAALREALRLKPNYTMARNNLAVVLIDQGRFDEAICVLGELLRADPDFAQAQSNRGVAFMKQGRMAEAQACFERAIELSPEYPEAHRNRAVAWLFDGEFERGWPEFLWRWKCKDYPPHGYSQPLWDGAPLEGRTILLHAEQGMGDTLQFIRYAPWVKQQGGRVVVRCQKSLVQLLSHSAGIDQIAASNDELPPIDCRAALMDLPALCRTTLATVPRDVPYLFTDPSLVAQWRKRLASEPGFKIGINWQGNPQYRGDRYRSIPLAQFAPLAAIDGVRLYSVQKGSGLEQLGTVGFPITDLGSRLDEGSGAFLETAAVMQGLDLVVTADTAPAHLAGALGVPVWVALSAAPEWRWMLDRQDSSWYPTMRLFRQSQLVHWGPVFAQMADQLQQLVEEQRGNVANGGLPIAD